MYARFGAVLVSAPHGDRLSGVSKPQARAGGYGRRFPQFFQRPVPAEFLCGREQRSGDRERRLPAAGVWKFSLKSGGGLDAGCHAASTR